MNAVAVKETLAQWRDNLVDYLPGNKIGKLLATGVGLYLLVAVIVGMYWSSAPPPFDVRDRAATYAAQDGGTVVTGSVTMGALMGVVDTLLEKSGGYLHNDRFPPGIWLDNMPNWEYGALVQVRDLARAMREVFSRSQSQSTEDPDLAIAEPRFNFDSNGWIMPASESEYRDGLKYARNYFRRLSDTDAPDAQFYARADNLRYWLATVDSRLGSLSQRLSASVGKSRINIDLAGDAEASQSTDTPAEQVIQTPWNEIDDVFFEARGAAWSLIHFLKAAEVDFAEVLQKKNARVSLRQIIRELEGTQETVWSPMILNGSGFGMLANHSLVMASYISRANAAIIDLRDLLSQG
ncbi:MAG: DUF2333 domain-containing protein [Gammaproteobacteria bacterium]|nr:MAG: DUF2333 domain-containing protein [Gammaproteobacteria bacterium]RLA51546.1 MAG: DUF2333 domain-containing protein [Gammaproteobacteria bacterium]HDY83841.1 DUF2333 family protein [Halieaceae bacterium]